MMHDLLVKARVESSVPVLSERRLRGEMFPRVPVGLEPEQVELSRELLAVALYTQHGSMSVLPTDEELMGHAARAVERFGVSGLEGLLPDFLALPLFGNRPGSDSGAYAYRLCVRHWYREGTAQPLSQAEAAVALYASGARTFRGRVVDADAVELIGFIYEGVSRLGVERLMRWGRNLHRELTVPPNRRTEFGLLPAEYQAGMADAVRRRACLKTSVNMSMAVRRPLLVELDAGRFLVGAVPPENPEYVRMLAKIRGEAGNARGGAR